MHTPPPSISGHASRRVRLTRPYSPLILGLAGLCVLSAVRAQAPAADAAAPKPGTAQVEVTVANLRGATGSLGCQLFAGEAGFPSDGDKARQALVAPIANGRASCRFADLPPGIYAIAVVHDENGNRKLDVNAFGVPKEGYGVSNNRTYALSSPKWEESRFSLAAGERRQLDIQLRY